MTELISIEWDILKQIAKTYLDIQKTRVGMGLRLDKLVEHHLLNKGLAYKEYVNIDDEDLDNYEATRNAGYKITLKESKDEDEQKKLDELIEYETRRFKETSEAYKLFYTHKTRMYKQEKDLLKESVELFNTSELWKWCLRVKGLGEVAGMTFISYVDPVKCPTIQQLFSLLGLAPESRLKKGQKANFNPRIKGRLIGVIAQNVIRSSDPYYATIYRIKKEYYAQRPDLVEIFNKNPKGWKSRINNMAIRLLIKLLVSHAYDILKYDRGLVNEIIIDHRNNIPLKPDDPIEQNKIFERYRYNHIVFLEKLKLAWANDPTPNKQKYHEYLNHGPANSDVARDLGLEE